MRNAILIIVPVYNEAQVISKVISDLQLTPYDLCFVNDGSTDESQQILEAMGVLVLTHPFNEGQGAALQTGMRYALENDYEIAVHFDADGQHAASDIHIIVKPILENKVDIVLGSRFLDRSQRDSIPGVKRLLLTCAVLFEKLRSGLELTDAHCGLRALSRRALQSMDLTCKGYAHASEIITLIKKHGLRYCEAPVHVTYSDYAMKKASDARRIFGILRELYLRKSNNPNKSKTDQIE